MKSRLFVIIYAFSIVSLISQNTNEDSTNASPFSWYNGLINGSSLSQSQISPYFLGKDYLKETLAVNSLKEVASMPVYTAEDNIDNGIVIPLPVNLPEQYLKIFGREKE